MWQVCATQSYVCFGGSLFGQPTRFAFHFSKIESFRDLDAGDTALVELIVEPEHDDDGEDDSCFIFMFDTPEARDLFSYDVRAAHSQTHVMCFLSDESAMVGLLGFKYLVTHVGNETNTDTKALLTL